MRFLVINGTSDYHLADWNIYDTETQIYYPMTSDSVAYAICELLNKK